jgi:hypothetical protein
MDNVQNCDSYTNIPSSQTYTSQPKKNNVFNLEFELPEDRRHYYLEVRKPLAANHPPPPPNIIPTSVAAKIHKLFFVIEDILGTFKCLC